MGCAAAKPQGRWGCVRGPHWLGLVSRGGSHAAVHGKQNLSVPLHMSRFGVSARPPNQSGLSGRAVLCQNRVAPEAETSCIHPDKIEYATLGLRDCVSHRRLLSSNGYRPSAKVEAKYLAHLKGHALPRAANQQVTETLEGGSTPCRGPVLSKRFYEEPQSTIPGQTCGQWS